MKKSTNRLRPHGLDRRRVAKLLAQAKNDRTVAGRIEIFSRYFLGLPYKSNPLVGSPDTAEVFTASLDGFDCVTYIETVLALARATTTAQFIDQLRKIRYRHGRIRWQSRNHYMSGWLRNNTRAAVVKPLSIRAVPTIARDRILDVVRGLPPHRTRLKFFPKRAASRLLAALQTGDLIFFVSTRKNLDVFHAGIVIRHAQTLLLRHASRSRGQVIEQLLTDFLKTNRMSGLIPIRPR